MNSRERVLTSLNHCQPDRVPIDIGGGISTSIAVECYEKLKRYLNISSPPKVLNEFARVSRIDESVMRLLGSDCRPLTIGPPSNWKPVCSVDGTLTDIWGVVWRKVCYGNGCYYWEVIHSPLANATIEDIQNYHWPDPTDPGFTNGLAAEAKALYEQTEYAIMADSGFKSFWELGYRLRGFDRLLMDVALNPDFVYALMSKLLEINIAVTSRFLDIVGQYIHVFRMGDDLATQNGLLISPQAYRKLIRLHYIRYIELVKSKTKAKVFFHSCGNIIALLDDLVEIGVDILNPVQVSALGDTASLKNRFGCKLVFWGGIDTQHVMPNGSAGDVETEVKIRIRDLAPGGGYVLASVHVLQPDVPPQNIVAMAEANRKFGLYPFGKCL